MEKDGYLALRKEHCLAGYPSRERHPMCVIFQSETVIHGCGQYRAQQSVVVRNGEHQWKRGLGVAKLQGHSCLDVHLPLKKEAARVLLGRMILDLLETSRDLLEN